MHRRSMRRLGAALITAAAGCGLAVGGCSAAEPSATTASTGAGPPIATTAAPREEARPGESQGAFVFRTQCAGCHGPTGEGNLGPPLAGVGDRMTEAEQVELVRTGRGRMPPFAP